MIRLGEQQITWQPGMTLDQVIKQIADGHLYAVVRLNGRLISRPDFSVTHVPDNAQIDPLPMIAGG